jgi:hypothetical protein
MIWALPKSTQNDNATTITWKETISGFKSTKLSCVSHNSLGHKFATYKQPFLRSIS